jgi:hypothetical protein
LALLEEGRGTDVVFCGLIEWLYARWQVLDDWVGEHIESPSAAGGR